MTTQGLFCALGLLVLAVSGFAGCAAPAAPAAVIIAPKLTGQGPQDLAWQIETVDGTGEVFWNTSLAVDAQGRAHITYYDRINQDLKYASFDGIAWHAETVESAGDVGVGSSLVLDAAGYPHISYTDYTHKN